MLSANTCWAHAEVQNLQRSEEGTQPTGVAQWEGLSCRMSPAR